MRAVVIRQSGGPEVLAVSEVPEQEPGRGEVKVRIKATGVNRADLLQRMGHYPSPPDAPPDIPGLEYAGVIDSVGPGVTEWKPGERVFGLAGGGTYAESVVVHALTVSRIPENLTFVEAASIPEMFITAYDAMVSQCKLAAGECVLIHAVGSGVGMAAVQIATMLGARTIGTARTESKINDAKRFGLEQGIVVSDQEFAAQVMERTGRAGVDLTLELVGGNYLGEDIHCAANKGRIIIVGLVAGLRCDIDMGMVLRKRLTIKGTTLRMRPLEEKIIASRLLSKNMVPLFEKGLLKPVVDKVLPMDKAPEAHEYVEKNQNFGKVVLEIA